MGWKVIHIYPITYIYIYNMYIYIYNQQQKRVFFFDLFARLRMCPNLGDIFLDVRDLPGPGLKWGSTWR